MESPRLGLFDWIDRTSTGSLLQLAFCDTVGMDLYLECTRECGIDGNDAAHPFAAGWLSLAMDSQLGRAHCHQHVALPVFGVVTTVDERSEPYEFFDETISKTLPY